MCRLPKQAKDDGYDFILVRAGKTVVAKGIPVSQAVATGLFEDVIKMKYTIGNDDLAPFDALQKEIKEKISTVLKENGF